MEIFYFNTQGEKIGPITKEVLINLAEAGTVTRETVFEINGKKVRGKQIKNLRPIFEKLETAGQNPPNTTDSADSAAATDSFPELPAGDEFAFPPMGAEEIAQHSEDVKSGAYTPDADKIFDTAFSDAAAQPVSNVRAYLPPSNHGSEEDSSGKPEVFESFWLSYKLGKVLLKAVFIIAAIAITIGYLAGIVANLASGGSDVPVIVIIILGALMWAVAMLILYVVYRLTMLPYYWMAAMVVSAEDTRKIKTLLRRRY